MAGITVKGDIQLLVDGLELEASLRFEPASDGAEWAIDGLVKLVTEARIAGVTNRRLEEVLQAFGKSRTRTLEIVARGQAPEPTIPEEAEWGDTSTPPEFQPFESAAIVDAPPPNLYKIRVDRVARERVVKRSGLLPFLPSKAEKIVDYDKVEVREPVAVDTRVLRSFWASKNAIVAKISPPRPGKPGKNVYGKPIPAERGDDLSFYIGNRLTRGKGLLLAAESGFVRVGIRWADLIPFGAGTYSTRLSLDGSTVLLDYSPGDSRLPPPDAETILKEAQELGQSAEQLISVEEIASALLKSTRSSQPLSGFSLSGDRDAEAKVTIAPDKLRASLTIIKGRGRGRALDLSMVSAALSGHRLKGVKVDKLKADVIAFYKSTETELLDYVLTEGKDPVRGKDRTIIYTVAFLPDAQASEYRAILEAAPSLSRVVRSLDEFGLSKATRIGLVKKGQEVARFSPPAAGQAGFDVYGGEIPAIPGNDPVIRIFENLQLSNESLQSEDDGLLLVAEENGQTMARVVPYRDARITVAIAEDALTASVSLEQGYGLGRDLSLDMLQEALNQASVVSSIDSKAMASALADAREGRAVVGRIVARGKPPVPAGGFRLNWLVHLATGSAVTLRADGSADYKNQDRATIVVEGQPILELQVIGVEGQDGTDVLGGVIPAPKNPLVTEVPTHDATIIDEAKENGDHVLKAARNGQLRFEKNMLCIDPAQKITGDVGPATGNIRFPGPVAITGTVLTGYTVMAGGDIYIAGSVEAALVSSGGSIRITEGIKGAKRGTIRAHKSIEAAFAEQAMMLSVDDIMLKNSALLCNIKTNGKLMLAGDRGHLVGGLCRARKGIEVQNLGSETGAPTQVSFGQDYLIMDAIEAEEREIERVKAGILEADKTMRDLEKSGGNLDKVRQDKLRLVKLLERRSLRIFELREKYEEHFTSEIVVRGSIFAGVVLESHNRFHEIRQTKQKVAFSFDPELGRVIERPLK
ncbi:MAG TPA: flagellar assembly protein A [bacterium]|nr:flagellar assembly protein A [bacterium]